MGKILRGTVVAQTGPSALPLWDKPADEPTLALGMDQAEVVLEEIFPCPV